jgi:hypothetical protein
MEFLHTDSDDPNSPVDSLRVNWYYRPRDVQRFNSDTRLVYATMHSDMCPLTSLRGLCVIKHRSEIEDLDAYRKERDTFYFVQVFDRFIRRWYECIPTSQIINVPEKVKKALDERWKFVAVETGRVKELTSAVKTCKRCTRFCAANESVDCAICKFSYHMNCVQPPLPKKPSRGFAWACAPCSRASERKLETHLTPSASGEVTEAEVEEEEPAPPEEALPLISNTTTRAPSPSESDEMIIDDHPATQAEIALAQMWPMRYLGIHCRVEDALQYDDRAIYPRASSRLGPRHQANVNVWHGRPVELVKAAEIKKRYMKGGAKKEGKLSKETVAALEADRVEKAKRPKWVQDEPTGYVARGEDYPNNDPRCTAKLIFKMPEIDESSKDDEEKSVAIRKKQSDEQALDKYLERARPLARKIGVPPFGTNFLDKAVELYAMNKFNAEVALEKLTKINRVTHLHEPVLSKNDLVKFEEGVAKYGSEHRLVRLHMKTNLPNSDIVRFYYLWKKTPKGREIWGTYPGRKGKKRLDNDTASRLHEEVAHDADDSAFDNDKAMKRKRNFQCKFCETTHARQWRRAPGTAPGQTVMVEVKNGPKEKRERMLVALCFRCAGLWRKYAIQYEDVEEVSKKITANAGKAWKRRIDEELLRELLAANELAAMLPPLEPQFAITDEPPKKKTKNEASTPAAIEQTKKKEKPAPAPKIPTPPPAPIIPDQPTWRQLPCAVCHTDNNTISCQHCMLTVHRSCYGVSDTQGVKSSGDVYWVCEQCQNDRNPQVSTDYSCCLCLTEETVVDMIDMPKSTHKKKNERDKEKERMEKELADTMRTDYATRQLTHHRPLLPREPLKPTTGNNWVHVYCAVFTPEIRFSDAQALAVAEGFQMIPASKYEAVCKLCKNRDHQNKLRNDKGACVNCHHCNTTFHVSCAFEAGYQFGFDITPVKGSRKDQQPVATLNGETGALTAAIWCKEHNIKSIVHPIHEIADDSGRTALEVYTELYKQADLTLTGTVRKAEQVQFTKSKGGQLANAANRRESTTHNNTVGARRGARNSTVADARYEDVDGATDASSLREGSIAPQGKRCVKCNIDVTPKWHIKPKDEDSSSPKSSDKRLSMTLGEIADQQRDQPSDAGTVAPNGAEATHTADPSRPQQNIRFMAPGANGRAWDGMPERNAPRPLDGDAPPPPGSTITNGAQPVSHDQGHATTTGANGRSDADDNAPTEYLCHKCFVKRKLDPTPPPPSPPPRRELSPPKTYPLQLDWNEHSAQRPPHPPSPWDDPSRPSQMAQGELPPPQMGSMGPGPGFMHQPPPHLGFPPTYHHTPNGFPGPHPAYSAYGPYPPQPSPNQGGYHPAHRPSLNGFAPPGQHMPNGVSSPHGPHMQPPPGYPNGPPHPQFGSRRTESPFATHLPPLGGPLYGSPGPHYQHPDNQAPMPPQPPQPLQPPQPQPQQPSTSAPVQPSPQTGHANADGLSGSSATPHENQSNGTVATSGASASPSLHNLLS